mmetsp:Transcript_14185/g.28454  ORF Transcript_14185/g.28454 Transcript_14185/m.28454 type:complete len:93 (+) Transcript_14185:779-1057(+)
MHACVYSGINLHLVTELARSWYVSGALKESGSIDRPIGGSCTHYFLTHSLIPPIDHLILPSFGRSRSVGWLVCRSSFSASLVSFFLPSFSFC